VGPYLRLELQFNEFVSGEVRVFHHFIRKKCFFAKINFALI
jgi:hypothetical protein